MDQSLALQMRAAFIFWSFDEQTGRLREQKPKQFAFVMPNSIKMLPLLSSLIWRHIKYP
jgi:hypothetical protein